MEAVEDFLPGGGLRRAERGEVRGTDDVQACVLEAERGAARWAELRNVLAGQGGGRAGVRRRGLGGPETAVHRVVAPHNVLAQDERVLVARLGDDLWRHALLKAAAVGDPVPVCVHTSAKRTET